MRPGAKGSVDKLLYFLASEGKSRPWISRHTRICQGRTEERMVCLSACLPVQPVSMFIWFLFLSMVLFV